MSLEALQPHLDQAVAKYHELLSYGNPVVRNWPLMNPVHVAAITLAYLVVVFLLVQHTKRRATPYTVTLLALVHNTTLTVLSFYMMAEILRQAFVVNNYSLFSNPVDNSEKGYGMAQVLYIYYLSKILEFTDTFIMALKKNYHQITFLHLYHHASIFVVWWAVVYYAPGGESYFSAALNSFIHVVLYGYYLWSSLVPKQKDAPERKPRWNEPAFYRKYITTMQLTQFMMMLVQAIYDSVFPTEGYPYFCAPLLFFYMLTMLSLFGNFFLKAYTKKPAKGQTNGHTNGNGHAKKHE